MIVTRMRVFVNDGRAETCVLPGWSTTVKYL